MSEQVVMSATLKCSEGLSPSTLAVVPMHRVTVEGMPAATKMDFAPMVNIMPFGMCKTQANPAVAAATSAASGTPTPAPCVPVVVSPWSSGSPSVKIGNFAALTKNCTCNCMWGGTIEVTHAGQTSDNIEA